MCDRQRSDSITNDAPGGGRGAVVVAPSCTVNVYSHKAGAEVELCTERPDRGAGGRGATGQAGVGLVEMTTQTSKRCEVVVQSPPRAQIYAEAPAVGGNHGPSWGDRSEDRGAGERRGSHPLAELQRDSRLLPQAIGEQTRGAGEVRFGRIVETKWHDITIGELFT
jgi:hypothetical protein